MALALALAVIAVVLFGLGFAIKWLFILAAVALLAALVMGFTGRAHTRV